jgi:predicted aspartyl protease
MSVRAVFALCLLTSPVISCGSHQNKAVARIPFELTNNLVLLQARVNDSESLPLILDTGASTSVVNQRLVEELGLNIEGEVEATTGGGTVKASFVRGVTLSIPGVEVPNVTLAAIPLSGFEAGLGQPVGGIIGYDIFKLYVVEIDFASRVVRLYEPLGYRYSGKGQALPITIEEQIPFIRARIIRPGGGIAEGTFEFDTGQVGALTLTNPFVSQNKLLESSQKTLQITTGAILPGRVNARVSRVGAIQLGRFVIKEPVTSIAQGAQDAGVESGKAGLIGGEILSRFTVIVDYTRARVILEANSQFESPFEFDKSGMSLSAQGENFRTYRVRTLVEGAPAAEAGVRVGDIITAINGRSVAGMTLSQVRQMLRQENKEYLLSIKRDDHATRLKLRTRKLI